VPYFYSIPVIISISITSGNNVNNQEFFDKSVRHLFAQKVPSIINGNCKYRGPNGTMCAVGCHIPDDLYKEEFENKSSGSIVDCYVNIHEIFEHVDIRLIRDTQIAHDNSARAILLFRKKSRNYMERLDSQLRDVAKKYRLTWPEDCQLTEDKNVSQ
jgi:hypothetical protein